MFVTITMALEFQNQKLLREIFLKHHHCTNEETEPEGSDLPGVMQLLCSRVTT